MRKPTLPLTRMRVLLALSLALSAAPAMGLTADAPASSADEVAAPNNHEVAEVTVTGQLDARALDRAINQFVESHAKPSALIGQIGRWRENVCPKVSGLRDPFGEMISKRVIAVAHGVGAPTRAAGKKCATNVEVVFTAEPQALLDHIAKHYRAMLGYYLKAESHQVMTFSHPVQAWYETGTRALDYQPPGPCSKNCAAPIPPSGITPFVTGMVEDTDETAGSGATGTAGSRLTHGLRSEFIHVLVIVDAKAVAKYPLQAVADYIALLTLTRIAALDRCSTLPTILNLFPPDCTAPPMSLTGPDAAYLKALYATDLDKNLNVEQGDMHDRMLDGLGRQ